MPIDTQPVVTIGQVKTVKFFTFNLSGTGTQDILTATGDVCVTNIVIYVKTSGLGLISLSLINNETSPRTILGTTLLSGITGGNNLSPYTTPFIMSDTKKLQAVFVGTATGGQLLIGVEYYKATGGDLN